MQAMVNSLFRTLAALSFSLVLGLARAQDSEPYEADPPDRAARLSYIQGDVSMQPAGEEDWAPAILNRPLTTGDKLWTERDARAEIQVGQAAVRLGANTGFSFLNVDDDTIQMRMTAGVINVRVRALDENDHVEIDTPNVALSLVRPGNYRVEFDDPANVTVVRISEGEAEATGPSQNFVVHNQEVATVRGIEGQGVQFGTLGAPDEFDSWGLERDRSYERVASSPTAEYVSPEVTGYEDLDHNGTWSSEAEYGYVWTPSRVSAGWAPYQYGRWVWVSPWGWTWIDDAPWGYAPFHYGRWAYARNRWCWVPGPRHVRAVYAPAVVGWVGGPGFNIGVTSGPGRVGWFPLGPRDVYVPPRRYSHRYVERVNVTNAIVNRVYLRNVYENRGRNFRYRNREVPGAVTAVDRNVFTSAGRVGDHRVRGDDRDFSRAVATAVAPQIAPSRESRLGGAAHANVRVPPRNVVDRQVVVKRNPPPPVTRFTRSTGGRPEPLREADDLNPRPRVRDDRDRGNGRVAVDRDRSDRPPRTETSSPKTPPRVRTVAPDQRGSDERPRYERQPRTEISSPKMQPREQAVASDQRVSAERAREDRSQREERARQQQDRSQQERSQHERVQQEQRAQMFREQAANQQRRQAETQQRQQRQDNQVRQQHEQRRQQESAPAQRPAAPPQQREHNTQRPRAERPAGNDGPRQRDNKNR
jgi:hypothetical protein